MGATTATERPILVTGTHRSGTTWVGTMLALSRRVHYVHEPFAPMYERSWLREPPLHRYYYEPPGNLGRFASDMDRITTLRPPWLAIAQRAGGLRNAARMAEDAVRTTAARRRGARALIKDPFALLSAEWIVRHTGADPIVLVRHPAAFAGSVKRLGWRLDVTWLLDQQELMETKLEHFRTALEHDRDSGHDIIEHAVLVWNVLNTVVLGYAREHPDWLVLRYEDLAEDPVPAFRGLYKQLGLRWSERIATEIDKRNSPERTADVPEASRGGTDRDSRQAIRTWTKRLTPDEIHRVRAGTEAVAGHWYGDSAWVN